VRIALVALLAVAASGDHAVGRNVSRPEDPNRRAPARAPRPSYAPAAPAPVRPAPAAPVPAAAVPRREREPGGARVEWSDIAMARLPENAPAPALDGEAWIAARDLARLLDATRFWRADVRRLTLQTRGHRLLFVADNPFAIVDDRVVLLPSAVRTVDGELHVPVAFVDSLPRDSLIARLVYDPRRGRVFRVPAHGLVGTPRIESGEGFVRVAFPADRTAEATVVGLGRAHFRLHFPGFFVGSLPPEIPGGLLRSLRAIPSATGSAFELGIAPSAAGFRIDRDAGRLTLEVAAAARPGLEAFAPEDVPGPRPLRVIVLDPGHGGSDPGVTAAGVVEKDLTLALARGLKAELERRMLAQVLLTRDGDVGLTQRERAERANRARADLVLSLHFDGSPGPGTSGATAYCPPAVLGAAVPGPAGASTPVVVLAWRDAATRHAVRSRELAEFLRGALELSGQGPARIRERLAHPLLGVNAPALLLEVATLTSRADRERVTSPEGLPALAAALAAGIDAYRAGGLEAAP
jgi:N-acetylmuramoyl-L-alanine amidase